MHRRRRSPVHSVELTFFVMNEYVSQGVSVMNESVIVQLSLRTNLNWIRVGPVLGMQHASVMLMIVVTPSWLSNSGNRSRLAHSLRLRGGHGETGEIDSLQTVQHPWSLETL